MTNQCETYTLTIGISHKRTFWTMLVNGLKRPIQLRDSKAEVLETRYLPCTRSYSLVYMPT